MGVMRLDDDKVSYYNSVVALGDSEPVFYDKTHLVPFGEYFPVPQRRARVAAPHEPAEFRFRSRGG